MTTLTTCTICEGKHSAMREHCPFCGARRLFIAHHSYQPYEIVMRARNAANLNLEIVRAYRSDIAYAPLENPVVRN